MCKCTVQCTYTVLSVHVSVGYIHKDAHTLYGLGRGSQRLSAEGSKDEVKWLKDIRYQTHVEQED